MSEKLLAAGSVTLMAAGSLLGASAAQAATVADCGTHPGATVSLINGTICEVVYDTVGAHSFNPPAGITAFEAVLIGGGAGAGKITVTEVPDSLRQEVGYGGWVNHFVYEDFGGAYDVYVGAGGSDELEHWTNSEPVFTGESSGEASYLGEESADGAENIEFAPDFLDDFYDDFLIEWTRGSALSDTGIVGEDNPLFPVIAGESRYSFNGLVFANVGDCPVAKPVPGSGGNVCGTIYEDGMSGAVFIRWALPAKLASTGVDASAIGIGAGALLAGGVALGAVAAVRRARAKN
jgi:hypothetical protein